MPRLARTLLPWCLAFAFSVLAGEPARARCAFVDVDVDLEAAPREQCFDLGRRCLGSEHWGCFKARLEFDPGVIRRSGSPDRRRTAARFGYLDPLGVHWDVPAGFVTDGASIPPVFKPLIGGSFDERYVRAAVLHDFYIRRLTADPESVHRLFFHALLASGTAPDRALLMYWAVRKYGPHWSSIDLAAYERKRQENLERIERENERFRLEYESCLTRHVRELAAPPGQRQWVSCPLDGRHQFMLDLLGIVRDGITRSLDDFAAGRCRKIGEDKYDCTPPEEPARTGARAAGACNYQCGVSLCCAITTEAECAAKGHSVFLPDELDACPAWAAPAPKR